MAYDNDNIEEHSILLAVMQDTLVNYLCWSVMSGVDTCYCCVSDDTELGAGKLSDVRNFVCKLLSHTESSEKQVSDYLLLVIFTLLNC